MRIFETTTAGDTLSLVVKASSLDLTVATEFKAACIDAIPPEIHSVVADLSSLTFLDSAGVGALLSLYKRLPQPHRSVKLRGLQPPVLAVIELLRLDRIFEIEP